LVDNDGNEQWVLPYGLNDTLYGDAREGVIETSTGSYLGMGSEWLSQNIGHPAFLKFDDNGNETGFFTVLSNQIDTTLIQGGIKSIFPIDTFYFFQGGFESTIPGHPHVVTDFLSNTKISPDSIRFYALRNHPTGGPTSATTIKESKILSGSTQWGTDWTIYLAKMNLQLDMDSLDNTQHSYDSLCNHPITSGFISMSGCQVINSLEELPSPEEYYASLQRIQITPYPNPASGYIIFRLENTQYHSEMIFQCLDMMGRVVLRKQLEKGSESVALDLSAVQSGMYSAVVFSNGKIVGRSRFIKL
jgi:hypothetical protein